MILTFGGVLLLNFVSLLIVMSVQGVQNISAGAHESLGITIVVCLLLQALFGLANDRLHGTSSPLNKLVRFVSGSYIISKKMN